MLLVLKRILLGLPDHVNTGVVTILSFASIAFCEYGIFSVKWSGENGRENGDIPGNVTPREVGSSGKTSFRTVSNFSSVTSICGRGIAKCNFSPSMILYGCIFSSRKYSTTLPSSNVNSNGASLAVANTPIDTIITKAKIKAINLLVFMINSPF